MVPVNGEEMLDHDPRLHKVFIVPEVSLMEPVIGEKKLVVVWGPNVVHLVAVDSIPPSVGTVKP